MSSAIAEKVHLLTDRVQLTQQEVGDIVGANARTVARWSAGKTRPQRDARDRLLELSYVAELAAEVIRPEDVNLWIFSPNRLLEGDSPADRIRAGQYRDVLAVLDALAEGVVV